MATLLIRNGPDVSKDGRICKQKYDVIEVCRDNMKWTGKSGSHGREFKINGVGNFVHLRVHVPGLSLGMKGYVESRHQEWEMPQGIGEFADERKPVVDLPRRYYLDISALPDWAQKNLEYGGECTLPPHLALSTIKRRGDDEPDRDIFECVKGTV